MVPLSHSYIHMHVIGTPESQVSYEVVKYFDVERQVCGVHRFLNCFCLTFEMEVTLTTESYLILQFLFLQMRWESGTDLLRSYLYAFCTKLWNLIILLSHFFLCISASASLLCQ